MCFSFSLSMLNQLVKASAMLVVYMTWEMQYVNRKFIKYFKRVPAKSKNSCLNLEKRYKEQLKNLNCKVYKFVRMAYFSSTRRPLTIILSPQKICLKDSNWCTGYYPSTKWRWIYQLLMREEFFPFSNICGSEKGNNKRLYFAAQPIVLVS